MARKREILEALLRCLLNSSSQRRSEFEIFIAGHPIAQDYAEFRAKSEGERKVWFAWPAENRQGRLRSEDYDAFRKLYHLYVQWQCAEQMAEVAARARHRGTALYLDFPLGVNPDGYDVWRHQDLFALGISGGAPPDELFTGGQNWGFPPLHPESIRVHGYRYYGDCLRHHMRSAGMLRIDHVMGLHRAYWVPDGFSATDGVYVHYRAPEFYAILNLESHRHQVQIVGENLGTVPEAVNTTLARRKIFGMHVGQFAISSDPRNRGTALYLDFPLGVNPDGYDVWRHQDLFALGISGGAPPDELFTGGQNWGFPPLHPESIRVHGYRYYGDCLRHHMRSAGMLRIDHVMGLHRAYWVPDGFSATDGVYVHYRAPEFYAILNLESHRHQVQIVGENLGTVPEAVNTTLARRKIFGMHVGQFGISSDPNRALDATPADAVASLNTHDTATFMGFWQEKDIDDRIALGLLDNEQAESARRYRAAQRDALIAYLRSQGFIGEQSSEADVLRGWLTFLAAQPAQFLLINLEDLWLEPTPQNVPGTWQERPNWQRKARYSLEDIGSQAALHDLLQTISDIRNRMV